MTTHRAVILGPALLLAFLVALPPPVAAPGVPPVYLYVNDLSVPGALLGSEESSLTDLCHEIDVKTTAEVAILVVNTTLPLGIDLFAARTFEANSIGKAGKDNGVLIVVSTDEGAWRIEVGYGVEYVLTDAKVATYARDWLEPQIAVGDYYGGLYDVTLAIGQDLVDHYDPGGGAAPPRLWVFDWPGIALGVAVFLALSMLTRGRLVLWVGNVLRRGGFGGGRSGGGGASGR